MKLKKIKPYLWMVLVGYLMLMVGVYLKDDLPFFLGLGGIFTMGLGVLSWMGNVLGIPDSDSDRHEQEKPTWKESSHIKRCPGCGRGHD